jgi:hypothetical protein
MNTYTVTVAPNSDAFAAIRRLDPDALIEFESGDTQFEHYTINTNFDLQRLLDAETGIQVWDCSLDEVADFPPRPPILGEKFQDWDCWDHPSLGFQRVKRPPAPIERISDYALTILIDENSVAAAAEWRRRYPQGAASRAGTKVWARGYDEKALTL